MEKIAPDAVHVWLVLNKAYAAVGRCTVAQLQKAKLNDSDFRVLEVLLHKGPLPVNAIGPKVNLTPGSISVAVDRLHARKLVSRVESSDDRRIRMVALTPHGRDLITPVFLEHAAVIREIFAHLSCGELQQLEDALKKIGRRAEALHPCNRNIAGCGKP